MMLTVHQSAVPNPLARLVSDQLQPMFEAIDKVSGKLFLDAVICSGIEKGDEELGDNRPSTDSECTCVRFMFQMDLECDALEPLPSQLTEWLKGGAAQLDIARIGIEAIQDQRDLESLRRLVDSGNEVSV